MFYIEPFQVPVSHTGYYYWNNKFKKKIEPGFYSNGGLGRNKGKLYNLPDYGQLIDIRNQEVATKDNITLRIGAFCEYKIINGEKFISSFHSQYEHQSFVDKCNFELRNDIQLLLRETIFSVDSISLSDSQDKIRNIEVKELNKKLKEFGIEIVRVVIRDIGFPKKIQELFAKRLETNIRSQTDLENARTVVATTRALKNASKAIDNDESARFLYYLETISKIASKGNHSFNISNGEKK